MVIRHKGCDGVVNDRRICERCGDELGVRDAYGAPRARDQSAPR